MTHQITLSSCRRVEGSIRVPGDKSISHRALLVGAMAEGTSTIKGLSPAADVRSSRAAVEALGVKITNPYHNSSLDIEAAPLSTDDLGRELLVESPGLFALRSPADALDVGNSGTTIRLLLGILAGSRVSATLTGDAAIRRRPMARVVDPLRAMGANIDGADGGNLAPLTIRGAALRGGTFELPVASAQVKSALLLAGLQAEGETVVIEPGPSRDHTERLLRYVGVPVETTLYRHSVKSTKLYGATFQVPGDLSSAAFLLVAAAVLPGSHVRIDEVGINETRSGILDVLREFGATVTVEDVREICGEPVGTVSVRAGDRRPVDVAGDRVVTSIDELPLVALLGAVAEGETVVRDAGELRVKESDRIATITDGLRRMGADIVPTPDGFVVRGPCRLRGATVDSATDHRIAMTLAVAALIAEGETTITGWEAVPVSYPGFADDLAQLVVR